MDRDPDGGYLMRMRRAAEPFLTERQTEVLSAMAQGLQRTEVAKRLSIAPRSVRNHQSAAYRRLGAHNAPHAVYLAMQAGLLPGFGIRMSRHLLAALIEQVAEFQAVLNEMQEAEAEEE